MTLSPSDTVRLKPDYPTKVSHKKGKIIAKAGDTAKVISVHHETIIVELLNKERISVDIKYLEK